MQSFPRAPPLTTKHRVPKVAFDVLNLKKVFVCEVIQFGPEIAHNGGKELKASHMEISGIINQPQLMEAETRGCHLRRLILPHMKPAEGLEIRPKRTSQGVFTSRRGRVLPSFKKNRI